MSDIELSVQRIDKLTKLLEFEIKRLNIEASRPGWTSWAVLGGIASATWLLSYEIDKANIIWTTTLQAFVMMNFAYDIYRYISNILKQDTAMQSGGPRFGLAISTLGQARSAIFIDFIRCILIYYVLYFNLFKVVVPFKYMLEFYYGFIAIICFFALLLSYTKLPISINKKANRWVNVLILHIINIIMVGGVLGVLQYVGINNFKGSMSEFRVAGLFLVIMLLPTLITSTRINSALLAQLINIRRDLALESIDYNMAVRQLDIVLLGMKLSDVLQEDVSYIVSKLEDTNNKLAIYEKEITIIADKNKNEQNMSPNDKLIVEALEKSAEKTKEKVMLTIKEVGEKSKQLKSRINVLRGMSPNINEEVEQINNIIIAQIDALKKRVLGFIAINNK